MITTSFLFPFFSLKQRIPVGYLSKTGEFHRVVEWGWLNPGGGAFSTVADLAKVKNQRVCGTLI